MNRKRKRIKGQYCRWYFVREVIQQKPFINQKRKVKIQEAVQYVTQLDQLKMIK